MFQSGELHPRWKGGVTVTVDGYKRITAGKNRGQYEHRLLWEQEKGHIPRGKDVHHLNENRTDNRIENFELLNSRHHRVEALEKYNRSRKEKTCHGRS